MASQAWKGFERRICRLFGGQRRGPGGGSDDDGSGPFAIECKHVSRFALREDWLAQAKRQGRADGRPWALIIGRRNTRQWLFVCEGPVAVEICERAGLINPADAAEVVAIEAAEVAAF